MANIYEFQDTVQFWDKAKSYFVGQGNLRLALSGGSSAKILSVLKDDEFDFSTLELWQTDERFVPQNHSDSNAKLIRDLLGDSAFIEKFFPIQGDPISSSHMYESMLKEHKDGYLFDLAILGVGPDGHTASLFPSSDILNSQRLVEATETEVFAIQNRLTLTFKALKKSKKILVLMMGSNKRKIFKQITNPDTKFDECPARKLLDWEQVDILFLDA